MRTRTLIVQGRPQSRRRTALGTLVIACAATLALSACGDSANDPTPGAPATNVSSGPAPGNTDIATTEETTKVDDRAGVPGDESEHPPKSDDETKSSG